MNWTRVRAWMELNIARPSNISCLPSLPMAGGGGGVVCVNKSPHQIRRDTSAQSCGRQSWRRSCCCPTKMNNSNSPPIQSKVFAASERGNIYKLAHFLPLLGRSSIFYHVQKGVKHLSMFGRMIRLHSGLAWLSWMDDRILERTRCLLLFIVFVVSHTQTQFSIVQVHWSSIIGERRRRFVGGRFEGWSLHQLTHANYHHQHHDHGRRYRGLPIQYLPSVHDNSFNTHSPWLWHTS